jgi:hypothetical protein
MIWYEDYVQLVKTPLELCSHYRSMFDETVERARTRNDHLIDVEGHYFDIVDWYRIPSFGGLNGFFLLITGTIFAAPVLGNERVLLLEEFKKTIAWAVRSRYRYDGDRYPAFNTVKKLKAADSYKAALDSVPWP